MSENNEATIKEGFLCPICHTDMRSPQYLIDHFQDKHSEEQDLLKSLKDLVGKAKNKILKSEERELQPNQSVETCQKYYLEKSVPQDVGQFRCHIEYFKSVRRERLDHRTSETNKLIIRLDRFLRAEGADRKQVAQELVTWLDGTTVYMCPSCAASFNIARRQHHCRLCGSIMCNNCSCFLSYEDARSIIVPSRQRVNASSHKGDVETLRICLHCKGMLECRHQVQLNQNMQLPICELYEHLQKLRIDVQNNVDLYCKMYTSLTSGISNYQLQYAHSLKSTIAKEAEQLDLLSKRILSIPQDPDNPRAAQLQASIRRATSVYIKEELVTLPVLPSPVELAKIREERLQQNDGVLPLASVPIRQVAVTTGWSPSNHSGVTGTEVTDDPLIDQINQVRNFIKQAKEAHRYDEVQSLNENLKMLKEMFEKRRKENVR